MVLGRATAGNSAASKSSGEGDGDGETPLPGLSGAAQPQSFARALPRGAGCGGGLQGGAAMSDALTVARVEPPRDLQNWRIQKPDL